MNNDLMYDKNYNLPYNKNYFNIMYVQKNDQYVYTMVKALNKSLIMYFNNDPILCIHINKSNIDHGVDFQNLFEYYFLFDNLKSNKLNKKKINIDIIDKYELFITNLKSNENIALNINNKLYDIKPFFTEIIELDVTESKEDIYVIGICDIIKKSQNIKFEIGDKFSVRKNHLYSDENNYSIGTPETSPRNKKRRKDSKKIDIEKMNKYLSSSIGSDSEQDFDDNMNSPLSPRLKKMTNNDRLQLSPRLRNTTFTHYNNISIKLILKESNYINSVRRNSVGGY